MVAKIVWHQGELFPMVGFIVTNLLAYNLENLMRRLALPEAANRWSLTSIQTRMIGIGGRLVCHAMRLVFQLAEVLMATAWSSAQFKRLYDARAHPMRK